MHNFVESTSQIMKNSSLDEKHKLATIAAMCGKKLSGMLAEFIMVRGMIDESSLDRETRESIIEMFDEFIYEIRQHEEKLLHAQHLICKDIGDYHMNDSKHPR